MRFDFPTIMVLLVAVSGLIWLVDRWFFAPGRKGGADPAGEMAPEPKIVEYARSFFPVFLIVLLLRSFLVEPFRIPSSSMMPTLLVGDFILVNKFVYGIRLPILDQKMIDISEPGRGDVVVFRYPEDNRTPYIKRVVGVPGDRIAYRNKVLYLNGEQVTQKVLGRYEGYGSGRDMTGASHRRELLADRPHEILIINGFDSLNVQREVPEGHYFVLGDNRDNSKDSRFWGFVPDELLIGKAFTIWMNWDWEHGIEWKRIGTSID